jgi:hypothetical protein
MNEIKFRKYEEFWHFCFEECPLFKQGCAKGCGFRKYLAIPPFGEDYLGKLKGEINGSKNR